MNANRFRKQVHAHAQASVDWTGKLRVSFTVLIDKDTMRTPAQQLICGEVQAWTDSGKCPLAFTTKFSRWLVLGHGVTSQGYGSSQEIARHAQICYRLLRRSGMRFRIRPVAPVHYYPENESAVECVDYYEAYRGTLPPFV